MITRKTTKKRIKKMTGKSRKPMKFKNRSVIGLVEKVMMIGPEKERKVTARIDTGADICSMDTKLAKRLNLGPVERLKRIKSAHGIKKRPVVRGRVEIAKRRFKKVRFTLADRKHLRYKVLIGKNILKKGFLIDPNKEM
ncbi:hypothetical protein GOV06_03130 [Candidatus Woesearchaeota archaeon]|nr:hypothetical protein [Candidatus Woesearchaeota archaeon]